MEQMIVFLYDTSFCQSEEDDPQKAVLFFHPKWVSDQQRLALCGQLMGAAFFCSSVFSMPQVLTLQSGKFILKKFDQYILSVGSDQTLPDWILKERFHLLESLLEFYHKSFHAILAGVNYDYDVFVKKIYDIFESYSPLMECIVSTFGNLPAIKFPKKKSSMFLEAFQLLESCCTLEGVLGGTILHNGRVIATLLDPDVTKILAFTDPYRVRCGSEEIKTPFHLPVGVKLFKVYVKTSVYEAAESYETAKSAVSTGIPNENVSQGSDVKQDVAKIFTVPEEENGSTNTIVQKEVRETQFREVNRKRNRRYRKSKLESSLRERSKNLVLNRNVKICSTPTVEKKFVLDDLVSICSKPKPEAKPTTQSSSSSSTLVPDLVQACVKSKQAKKFLPLRYTYNYLNRISMDDLMIDLSYKNYPVPLRYYSFGLPKIYKETDNTFKDDKKGLKKNNFYKTIADPLNPVFRYDGLPISKTLYNHCLDEHYKDYITANITIDSREELIRRKNLENQLCKLKTEASAKVEESIPVSDVPVRTSNEKKHSNSENLETGESEETRVKELTKANQKIFRISLTLPLKPMSYMGSENNVSMSAVKSKVLHSRTPTTPLMTKLSLLVLEEENDKNAGNIVQQPQTRIRSKVIKNKREQKQSKATENVTDITRCGLFAYGQQNLTMLLLLDENAEQNPDLILSLRIVQEPEKMPTAVKSARRLESRPKSTRSKAGERTLISALSSDVSPTSLLLASSVEMNHYSLTEWIKRELRSFIPDRTHITTLRSRVIHSWELCTTNLEKVDHFREKSIDHVSGVDVNNYNFLSLDPHLGSIQKCGAWASDEIRAVGSLHQDLIQSPNIKEIIVRNEDAVIYGYRCGNTETFYHQGGCTAVGLPTPADLMGVIPLKARRRLERDHGVMLL